MVWKKAYRGCTFRIVFEIMVLVLLLAGGAGAVPIEQWNKTFGEQYDDFGNSVQQTSDGGYIIVGSTYSIEDSYDIWLIKTNSSGIEQWNKTFRSVYHNSGNSELGYSVQQTSDGGYIILGSSQAVSINDIWLIKTDSNGIEQWNKTFDYSPSIGSVQQTSDGGYIIMATSGVGEIWLIKTDSNGIEQWNKTFGDMFCEDGYCYGNWENGYSVQQTSDGGYIITGDNFYGSGLPLIKTDSNGIEQWNKTFGRPGFHNSGNWVRQTSDGGYIIVGRIDDAHNPPTIDYAILIKTDSNGIEQWNKTLYSYFLTKSVQQTSDGGYIIAGSIIPGYYIFDFDGRIIKTDSNGIEQWNKTFGGVGDDRINSGQQTSDGGYILAGSTTSYGDGSYDAWLIKLSSDISTGPVHNINKGTNYTTIQAAINDASPGDEIHVDSGTYYENVNVNKSLILKGIDTGGGKPVVDAMNNGNAITLSAERITLTEFNLTNASAGWPGAGVKVASNNNTVENNTLVNNRNGIYIANSEGNQIKNNSAFNNGQSGILFDSTNSNNLITNNNASYNSAEGISIYYGSGNLLSNNTALGNVYGIGVYYSNGNTIVRNNVSMNTGNGITVGNSNGNSIYHNNLIDNSQNGYDDSVTANSWDNGAEGNYWSDYTGTDSNGDGIGNTPYPISGGSGVDRYPLMAPYQPPTPKNQASYKPTELTQFKSDGTTQIIVGGATDERTVVFSAKVSDLDNDQVKLQIELRHIDEYGGQFDETQGGLKDSNLVPSGSEVTITVNDLIDRGYHWRARAIDEHGKTSDWVEFGNNPTPEADFIVSTTPTGEPLSVEIISPSEGSLVIEDEDTLFSSEVSGGTPPYTYEWKDDWQNLLSTSSAFYLNSYKLSGEPISSSYEYIISLNVKDNNGGQVLRLIKVYLSPPTPKIETEFQINGKKVPDVNWGEKYDLVVRLTNPNQNYHYYSLGMDQIPPDNIQKSWDTKIIGYQYTSSQKKLLLPGETKEYRFTYVNKWQWIPPQKLPEYINAASSVGVDLINNDLLDAYSYLAKGLTTYSNLQEKNQPLMSVDIGFKPNQESAVTLKNSNDLTKTVTVKMPTSPFQSNTKFSYFFISMISDTASTASSISKEIIGWPAIISSVIQTGVSLDAYQQAQDPTNDYQNVSKPEPIYFPEIDQMNDSPEKDLAKSYAELGSVYRAYTDSYIKYAGASDANDSTYMLLQLDATKNYSIQILQIMETIKKLHKIVYKKVGTLTEDQIRKIQDDVASNGLSEIEVNFYKREGIEWVIPYKIQSIVEADPKNYTNLNLTYSLLNLTTQSSILTSEELMKGVIELKINQFNEPILTATPQDIIDLENLKTTIQNDLNDRKYHEELNDQIQSMINKSKNLIERTNNISYIEYYNFAIQSLDENVNAFEPLVDYISPTTSINLSGMLGKNSWYISDVQVNFTATDNEGGSGINNIKYSFDNTTWNTYSTPFNISNEGTTTLYYYSIDNAGNIEPAKNETVNIDKTPPEITINTPASEHLLKQTIFADWSANDPVSGISSATGTTPSGEATDTATVGTKIFNVVVTDNAGNTMTKTVTYDVRYKYGGILQPINTDGSSIFKLGSTVPVKFQLTNSGGNFVNNAIAKIYIAKISAGILGTETEAISISAATMGNLFRYDSTNNQYIFNLGTKTLTTGTWQIRIELDDGTSKYATVGLK